MLKAFFEGQQCSIKTDSKITKLSVFKILIISVHVTCSSVLTANCLHVARNGMCNACAFFHITRLGDK